MIDSLLGETRTFEQSDHFRAQANITAEWCAQQSGRDHIDFWSEQAGRLDWVRPWHTAQEFAPATLVAGELTVPQAQWFLGGTLNAAVNCVGRQLCRPSRCRRQW